MALLVGEARAADTTPGATDAAEPAEGAVDQLVITARRREEKLQDTPITISAVTGETLKTERLDRVADYAAKIAKAAHQRGTTLKEEAVSSGLISAVDFDRLVRPDKMTHPG